MPHSVPLITTIAAALGFGLLFGFIAARLKLPPLVGYLVAGVMIGPSTPGLVANLQLAQELAEIGVMLLMFGVGLHFSLDDLLSVRRIALPGAVAQITAATTLGVLVARMWGWPLGAGLVFGLALSVASTVVLLRALESRGSLESINGKIAVGWLVVEDLATVLVLVLLPAVSGSLGGESPAGGGNLVTALAITLGKVSLFVALILGAGGRLLPWLLWQVARTGSRELFTLCVIAAAVGVAYTSAAVFGVSFALGAFFAGMVLGKSELSHRAATETLPLRDAFSVLFFVSVGMLFDPRMILDEPLRILMVVAIVLIGKSIAAFLIVLAFRYPLNTALTVSASLAQIGEFSFILAGLGVSLKLLPVEGQNLILAGSLISIALNPIIFRTIDPIQRMLARGREPALEEGEDEDDPLASLQADIDLDRLRDHVVLVGYGRVGKWITDDLNERGCPLIVIEQNRELVDRLRHSGVAAVFGDATERRVLARARIGEARLMVVAVPEAFRARKILETARDVRPGIETIIRSHGEEEAQLLEREGAGRVFVGEHVLASEMTDYVAARLAHEETTERKPA